MRSKYLSVNDLTFTYTPYDDALKQSYLNHGFSFPITIHIVDGVNIVKDGHKRCSLLADLKDDSPVLCNVDNAFEKAGNTYWGKMNHH